MKKTINFYDFRKAFENYDRLDNFSYDGLQALFDYFEEIEIDCDMEIELDVIAICCEYSELTIKEIVQFSQEAQIASRNRQYPCN